MNLPRSSISGFTLIELLVVLTIVGILTMIAVPNLTSLSESQRVKNTSFELFTLFNIARSEAIKRNADVNVAPVMVGGVFDRIDVTVVSDGTLLYSKAAPKKVGIDASVSDITYRRTGRTTSGGVGATFQIDVSGSGSGGVASPPTEFVRCITLGLSGAPQTRKGAC